MKTVPHTHLYLTCIIMTLFCSFSHAQANWSTCDIQANFLVNRFNKAGDLVLGGLFPIHVKPKYTKLSFTTKPEEPICYRFDLEGFRQSQVMAFAVAEINADPALLPNVTLGYRLYDTCCIWIGVGFKAAVSLVSGREERVRLDESCAAGSSPPVLGVIGPESSAQSIAMSSILGLYHVPLVSYFATCACLSDRRLFPSFFRTIPSDAFQVRAMRQLMKRFGWTWVGLVVSDDAYGRNAARSLKLDLERSGEACLAYIEVLPGNSNPEELQRIVSVMKTSTARVVAVFELGAHMKKMMAEVMRQNLTGLQWMASVSWATYPRFQTPEFMPYLTATLGIAIRRAEIPGLRDFLLNLRPDDEDPDNVREDNLLRQFWEHTFGCRFAPVPSGWLGDDGGGGGRVCSGREDLGASGTALLDVSDLRAEYNVYKAVYALAHALHDMLQCAPGTGPFPGHSCATATTVQPWQLVHYLETVSFTTPAGDHVSFDENGDPLPIYDVMNWAWLPDGSVELRKVGVASVSASGEEELLLDEDDIFWGFESNKPPRSVCSESCSPGTRLARRKGEPVCCFDCIACSDGQISNETDSPECAVCPEDFWSNARRDRCVPKSLEYLSYHEALGISLTAISLLGTLLCAGVLAVFVYHRDTPMVRANNSELSFQLLLSLKLCFLCALLFIGLPRTWTCQLRHAAFGISFVLCVSCILVKTMVVLAAFRATKPGGASIMKWFGAAQQRATVLALTSVQAVICAAWLATASPTPHKNTRYHSDVIVYECAVGSATGFAVLLGYIGVLALLSFALAFMARNLPDNFNEARLITFSMLVFCAVWVAFVPAYVSSPGKYADVVEVFAILASSFGLLLALFAPKCYIMLLKPERNTKKSIMGRGGPAKT